MSDTPRTDALVEANKELDNLQAHNAMLDHARQVEAELGQVTAQLGEHSRELATLRERLAEAERERDAYAMMAGRQCVIQKVIDELGPQTLCSLEKFKRMEQAEQRAERAEALAEQNAKAIAYFRQQVSLTLGDRVRAEWDADATRSAT